jgi:putative transposase
MAPRKQAPNRVDELIDELLGDDYSPEAVLGESGLLKQLTKRLIERALVGELNHHLKGQASDSEALEALEELSSAPSVARGRNRRNGYSSKTVQSKHGELDLSIPRDRAGAFEPILVPKHQRRLAGLDEKVIGLYARGLSVHDISAELKELYGVTVSESLISEVTDSVLEEVKAWQSRPLDEMYPISYLDALYVNIKVGGRVSKRAVYVVLGITRDGDKEVLGLWLGEAETEGAKFWLKVLTDLKNRGVQDILIACCDGLKGFPQAIESVFPQTQVQLCIVHLIRNSLRHVPWNEAKAVAASLKPIYQAPTLEDAEAALEAFSEQWDEKYPAISQIWLRHWENIIPIFDYPMAIRKVIYTTNAIESLNRSLRKVIKTKAVFPDESSVFKLMYLAMQNIAKRWNRPIKDWKAASSHFAILFPDRFQ